MSEDDKRIEESKLATARHSVYEDVTEERKYQDDKWGGPSHDDNNDKDDWTDILWEQVCMVDDNDGSEYRRQLIKVAATAVAAVESYDRVNK